MRRRSTNLWARKPLEEKIPVHVTMGSAGDDWDIHPRAGAIPIGTQGMLPSRAFNHRYAANRSRHSIQDRDRSDCRETPNRVSRELQGLDRPRRI